MSPQSLPFRATEYSDRLTRVRNSMLNSQIDILFVEDPSNMAWLTGYDGWSFYVHQGVLITHDSDPIWWGRFMDGQGALRTVYMSADNIRPYEDSYVQNTDKHPMEHLSQLIHELGYHKARIGVEMENYYFTARAWETLKESLPQASFVDATALVNWQRIIKSTAEAVVQAGTEAALDVARPGNTCGDIATAFYAELEKAGIDRDGRCGYSIGLSYPPDWGERTASIRKSDTTVLQANMTFHFMPAIWMDTWGLELTESIRIRENGPATCFCEYPRELVIKD